MKTAMQDFIDVLKIQQSLLDKEGSLPISAGVYAAQRIAEQYLEKEKQQILKARFDGFKIGSEVCNGEYPFEGKSDDEMSYRIANEEYYNQTYNI